MSESTLLEQPTGFAALGLDSRLVEALTASGYTEPTPIQRESIPHLAAGKDLIGLAATGTGKTAAFALPLLHRLVLARAEGKRGKPSVFILVPTRELCVQVAAAVARYGQPIGVTVLPVYGGAGFGDQARSLRAGVDVVVGTPGRVLDHIRRGTINLAGVSAVVLDEADEMLDMGFADDLEAILAATPAERQTMLFSATMPPRIASIAEKHLKDPVRVQVAKAVVPAGEKPKIRQVAYVVRRDHKLAALARVLEYEAPTAAIVFCRTRTEADGITDELATRGHRPESIHGGLSQEHRDRVMQRFRAGTVTLLVATDVAARGLDISHLSHVVNFGVPQAMETYVHRIGRVGRAGREGVAITVAEPREQHALRTAERLTAARVEFGKVPTSVELKTKRLERTRESLRELIQAGGLDEFRPLAEPIAAEFGPEALALAALALANRSERTDEEDAQDIPTVLPESRRPAGPGNGPRAGGPGGGSRMRGRPGMAKLFVAAGRASGVDRRVLVDAIGNEAGLSPREIGMIDVAERFALVEVPEDAADHVIESLSGIRVRGRRIAVRRDQRAGGRV